MTGARRSGDIGFASLRGGSVTGDHSVIFAGPMERIELTHRAEDRTMFAQGARESGIVGARQAAGFLFDDRRAGLDATSRTIEIENGILGMSDRLLVLVRHGQSDWNLKNLFTGWKDPDLSAQGVAEAKEAGRKLKAQGLSFDVAFTSVLTRAQHTLDLMLAEIGQTGLPTKKRSRAQRARLWRSLRPQQGRRPQEMGRGAGADLAPLL